MRILIAEDEVTIARALKVMLEKNKYAVDMVHNGNDALDYIQATTYDALVLDIMMPGKDGIEVLKAVRAAGITTPALFLTAKAEVADRVAGLDAGADDYLPKPFPGRDSAEQQGIPACGAVYAAPAPGLFLGASDGKGLGAGRGGRDRRGLDLHRILKEKAQADWCEY